MAAKSVDPQATIIMGGMMHWQDQGFFPQVLQALRADPDAARYGYFFDGTAWHWYSRASLVYDKTAWVRAQLQRSGIGPKRIWITEANLPVCGDEANGGFPRCEPGRHRGAPAQQAAFVVQAGAYSVAAAVERTVFFQFQDDELGPGDYYGLVRNNGTARPGLTAAQLVASTFRDVERVQRTVSAGGTVELITMYRRDGQRVMVAWSTNGEPKKVSLPNETLGATLMNAAGQTRALNALGEGFPVDLPAATLNDAPPGGPPDFIVGGEPLIVVERGVTYRQGTLAGTVRDPQGRPLANYPVRVGPTTATTDAAGRFSVALPPGLYDIELGERIGYWQAAPVFAVPVRGGATVERSVTAKQVNVIRFPLVGKGARP
ncbi:MAG: carboxypeptidase regulatory-like domain-containing protein [Chloroflexi bacterium]|nr:carboxypeptidase regulatory-like domain-containing protein [Chloroflexota bacterium]